MILEELQKERESLDKSASAQTTARNIHHLDETSEISKRRIDGHGEDDDSPMTDDNLCAGDSDNDDYGYLRPSETEDGNYAAASDGSSDNLRGYVTIRKLAEDYANVNLTPQRMTKNEQLRNHESPSTCGPCLNYENTSVRPKSLDRKEVRSKSESQTSKTAPTPPVGHRTLINRSSESGLDIEQSEDLPKRPANTETLKVPPVSFAADLQIKPRSLSAPDQDIISHMKQGLPADQDALSKQMDRISMAPETVIETAERPQQVNYENVHYPLSFGKRQEATTHHLPPPLPSPDQDNPHVVMANTAQEATGEDDNPLGNCNNDDSFNDLPEAPDMPKDEDTMPGVFEHVDQKVM